MLPFSNLADLKSSAGILARLCLIMYRWELVRPSGLLRNRENFGGNAKHISSQHLRGKPRNLESSPHSVKGNMTLGLSNHVQKGNLRSQVSWVYTCQTLKSQSQVRSHYLYLFLTCSFPTPTHSLSGVSAMLLSRVQDFPVCSRSACVTADI